MSDRTPEPTKAIGARLSHAQIEVLRQIIGQRPASEYIRELIEADMRRRGVSWPEYEVVTNEARAQRASRKRKKPV